MLSHKKSTKKKQLNYDKFKTAKPDYFYEQITAELPGVIENPDFKPEIKAGFLSGVTT